MANQTVATACYSYHELHDYALGLLPDEPSREIAEHLTGCVTCDETVASFDAEEDTLVRGLRQPRYTDPSDGSSVYRAALDRIRSLHPAQLAKDAAQQQIGEYLLVRQIGAGGMGAVYEAVHTRLERVVAIKVVRWGRLRDAHAVIRFQREMRIVGRLNHPAIVRATDAGEIDGVHFLAMEFIDGFDLSRLVALCGPLPVADACELIRQAAGGLQHAHLQGVVHRDIKPSNLMLDREGHVKILDLGLALVSGGEGVVDELTTVGQLMGTLDYIAPEQCDNSHQVDLRADIYSLSATLYKLLSGVAPYAHRLRRTPLETLRSLATEPVPLLTERRGDLPQALVQIVHRGLSRDAQQRFGSMQEFSRAIEPWCRASDLRALLSTAEQRQADHPVASGTVASEFSKLRECGPASATEAPPHRGARWVRWSIALAAGALLLVLAGFTIHVQTNTGQLVIECARPDVSVRILRDGRNYQRLELHQGQQSTRIHAGEYEVVVDGHADSLLVQDGKFTLRRGDTWIAKIEEIPNARASAPLELDKYTLGPGDVLGVFVEGVLGGTGALPPPIRSPRDSKLPPAFGVPILVQSDGRIGLPLVPPVEVAGKTLSEARGAMQAAYVDAGLIVGANYRSLVTLVERRTTDRQQILQSYRVRPGDVLGLAVPGILGDGEAVPPVSFPDDPALPPAVGYPVLVEGDGTIQLPLLGAAQSVAGLSLTEVRDKVLSAYAEGENPLLLKEHAFVMVTLMYKSGH